MYDDAFILVSFMIKVLTLLPEFNFSALQFVLIGKIFMLKSPENNPLRIKCLIRQSPCEVETKCFASAYLHPKLRLFLAGFFHKAFCFNMFSFGAAPE
ncbi:MAG: hypothetical protein DIZ78_01300 [endosymbiont of Escarpia spicata]|uniref:Uncharacterized protein n=1 Tax=endosymbiont of Escarpia spicata TaxID=2200908 RepID=A0A370DTR5_9GAMM|nr:MAG: hypothetical protein DIZ78_01300 [endosymbiont of Escarpia spicata]